jgi:hypothetical protein
VVLGGVVQDEARIMLIRASAGFDHFWRDGEARLPVRTGRLVRPDATQLDRAGTKQPGH